MLNRRVIANGLVFAANLVLGAWVVSSLYVRLQERRGEVDAVRHAAVQERQATEELRHQVAVQEATLAGLRQDDPYVIEMLAREKLGWEGPDEVRPPPLPEP